MTRCLSDIINTELITCSLLAFNLCYPQFFLTYGSKSGQCPAKLQTIKHNTYGHSSSPRDRTLLMCEPRFRCTPEHSMHISTPRFRLAHSGSKNNQKNSHYKQTIPLLRGTQFNLLGESQSTQYPLPGTLLRIDCIEAISLGFSGFDFDDSMPCSDLKISCSITDTHSSRSSELDASKCHCLLSSDTM